MVDLGVPTAYFGPPLDTRIDKLGRIIPKPEGPWYPNVAFSKFDAVGALANYRGQIAKETPEIRKRNGYSLRNAIKFPALPTHPHLADPKKERGPPPVGGGVDVREWGFDPNSEDGQFLRKCVDDRRGRRGPQDRLPFTGTSQQITGWTQAKPLEAYRSRSAPGLQEEYFSTEYEWLRPTLEENAARRQRKREKMVAAAEADVEQALIRCASYTCHGDTSKKWSKPKGETDATAFENEFIKAMRIPISKVTFKPNFPVVLRKPGSQQYCELWKP